MDKDCDRPRQGKFFHVLVASQDEDSQEAAAILGEKPAIKLSI